MILDKNTEEMIIMANVMTPAEFAVEVGSDGKTVRKFLRSITPKDEQPGKGSRWQLDGNKRSIATMTKNFNAWKAEQAKLAAERAQKAAEVAAEAVEVEETE
jgi:hypothetical protein